MIARAAILAALPFLLPSASVAGIFDGLFFFPRATAEESAGAPGQGALSSVVGPDEAVCLRAIREAERTHGIPKDLLMAIGLQEAGRTVRGVRTIWPWSVNVEGRGHRFDTRAEAEAFVQAQLAAGRRSIDVGCLQINLRWHPDAFPAPAAGFDPFLNADYAARFLRDLHARTGDWVQAAGGYHSFTPERQEIYLAGIARQFASLGTGAAALDALAATAEAAPATGILPPARAHPPGIRVASMTPHRMHPLRAPARQLRPADPAYPRVPEPLPASAARRPPVPAAAEQAEAGWSAALSETRGGAASLFGGPARPLFARSP